MPFHPSIARPMNDITRTRRRNLLKGLAGAALLPLASPSVAADHPARPPVVPPPVATSAWPQYLTPAEAAALAAVAW